MATRGGSYSVGAARTGSPAKEGGGSKNAKTKSRQRLNTFASDRRRNRRISRFFAISDSSLLFILSYIDFALPPILKAKKSLSKRGNPRAGKRENRGEDGSAIGQNERTHLVPRYEISLGSAQIIQPRTLPLQGTKAGKQRVESPLRGTQRNLF